MNGLIDVYMSHKKILDREPSWQELDDYMTMLNQYAIKRNEIG